MVDECDEFRGAFGALRDGWRTSIARERLLRAMPLQLLYSIRSERWLSKGLTSTCCFADLSVLYCPKDGSGRTAFVGRKAQADLRQTKPSNEPYTSTTDSETRLFTNGKKAGWPFSATCQ
jgi:hypothetical protein